MKAILQSRYGEPQEVLSLGQIEVPEVGEGEVLVRVLATSVHADVWHAVTGRPWAVRPLGTGLLRPKGPVPGTDLAGRVEAVGAGVRRFRSGDAVFGVCRVRMGWSNGGTFAEYAAVPEAALAPKPEGASFEAAAAVATAGHIALLNLRGSAAVGPGDEVLINGAGGAVGSVALQVAKARGATVTAVDRADKLAMLRRLGADRVVDYRREDCTRGPARYDLILDVASTLALHDCRRVLKPTGTYVIIGHEHYGAVGGPVLGGLPHFFKLVALGPFDRHLPRMGAAPRRTTTDLMAELAARLDAGQLTPVIDRVFPLAEAGAALCHLARGSGVGRIVLAPGADGPARG